MMDLAPEQKYAPNQWVKYKLGSGGGISKIVGAVFYRNKGWYYTVVNPSDQKATLIISEDDIIEQIETA